MHQQQPRGLDDAPLRPFVARRLDDVAALLASPFPPDVVRHRIGPTWEREGVRWTRPLSYIDARAVFERLDAAVGPSGWSTDLVPIGSGAMICRLTVLGVTKADVGQAGDSEHEREKSAASDAVKRAAVQFGVGRQLYAVENPAVALERRGNDWVLPKGWRPPATTPSSTSSPPPRPTTASPTEPAPRPRPITERQLATIRDVAGRRAGGDAELERLLDGRPLDDLTTAQASRLIEKLLDHQTRPSRRVG